MTQENLVKLVKERLKDQVDFTEEMIVAAVASIYGDVETIMANKKAEFTVRIWDKVSPINGAPASYVLKDPPHTLPDWTGLTLLIDHDGKTLYLQPADFREQGWQPITSEAMAFELADVMLSPAMEEAVVTEVIKKLRGE